MRKDFIGMRVRQAVTCILYHFMCDIAVLRSELAHSTGRDHMILRPPDRKDRQATAPQRHMLSFHGSGQDALHTGQDCGNKSLKRELRLLTFGNIGAHCA